MQKRLVRKLDLEIALSKIKQHPSPNVHLEQYTVTPKVAAEILYIAAYTHNDITNKSVADFGCGTGRLAIGSALLGAEETVGIDIDKIATKTAFENALKMEVKEKTQWVTANIAAITGAFDTILQNPPFGIQQRKADRVFIEKALEIGKRVYSLHKSSKGNLDFIKNIIDTHHGKIEALYTMPMTIPHMFHFHKKRRYTFPVDLYVIGTRI